MQEVAQFLDFSIAFYIGNFGIRWYAIFYLIAFISCILFVILKLHFWKKVPWDPFFYYVFIGVPVSIFGGRIWDIITGSTVVNSFAEVFGFENGTFVGISGLSIQGGVIFAVLAAVLWFSFILRRPKYMVRTPFGQVQQVSMWVYADAIVPVVLLGQVIGRWGNFFNHELYGPVAQSGELDWLKAFMPEVWKHMHIMELPNSAGAFDPSLLPRNLHHPMFLYESFANFVGFVAIFFGLEFVKKLKAGTYCGFYFIWYGLVRISMEAFKQGYDTTPYFVVAGLFILAGAAVFSWGQWINFRYCRNLKLFRLTRYFTFYALQFCWAKITRKTEVKRPWERINLKDYYRRDYWYAGR